MYMWQTKVFSSQESMDKWIEENKGLIEVEEVFVDNAYSIDFRFLKIVNIE